MFWKALFKAYVWTHFTRIWHQLFHFILLHLFKYKWQFIPFSCETEHLIPGKAELVRRFIFTKLEIYSYSNSVSNTVSTLPQIEFMKVTGISWDLIYPCFWLPEIIFYLFWSSLGISIWNEKMFPRVIR